ncbi:MAG: membrane dipeptidase [Ruminococcaceae bacterium]|nr:membrane dipeptidase [Oscillospiraceae bacterium]
MYIVDSHCDSIEKAEAGVFGIVNPYNFSRRHPQLQFVALFCGDEGVTPPEANALIHRYIARFRLAMEEEGERIVPVTSYSGIERAFAEGKHGALLTLESGTGLMGDRAILRQCYDMGIRVVGLTWLSNDLAMSNRIAEGEADTGLTALGREMVEEGNGLGMIFDVSHGSDRTFWDLMELAEKPPLATHSNFRAVCPHSRNLTDEMAVALFKSGGMVGLNLCVKFISEDEVGRTAEGLFRHLDHGLSLGGEEHMGFGCDIDGIGGVYPSPLSEGESIHDRLIELMLRENYSESLVRRIAGGNYLAYLKRWLG